MDLKEENILGAEIENHWYYRTKALALKKIIGAKTYRNILDVGAGSGFFAKYCIKNKIADKAVCVDPAYESEYEEENVQFVKNYHHNDADLILMMDVLEHVPNDVDLLKQYTEKAPADVDILITVPAFQFMWSGHDVFLEHYRRYTIKTLHRSIKSANLVPVKTSYFYASLFPIVAMMRGIKNIVNKAKATQPKSELKIYPKNVNALLEKIHIAEKNLIFPQNKFYGLSLFCLCRKQSE